MNLKGEKNIKFAHLADCHLGGWRQEELQRLNLESFRKTVNTCIKESVDFILISGDLFDSAYPSIEILKESFCEFRKIRDSNIPVYIIAGSHDFSASGKTFLDVLEKAGFCKNVENWNYTEDDKIKLNPTMHGDIAIYGYPGRKSGMEIDDLRKVVFTSNAQFSIFMLHTTIKDVVGTIPMDSINKDTLPPVNYYALGHIHQRFDKKEFNSRYVYPGPTFPNNFQELSDLKQGSFQIVEIIAGETKTKSMIIPTKEVIFLEIKLENGLTATDEIIKRIDKLNLKNKILLMKLKGTLKEGKTGDIQFTEIEEFVKKKEAYVFLRNISALKVFESDMIQTASSSENVETLEKEIMGEYSNKNPTIFNKYLPMLMNILSIEKNEDEKSAIFEERLVSELKGALDLKEVIK